MSKKVDLEELRTMEPDTLLYGALVSLLSEDRPEAIGALSVLLEKLKNEVDLNPHNVVDVLCCVMDDLNELGYFDQEDDDAETGVEFEIRTFQDEDPKKRLN